MAKSPIVLNLDMKLEADDIESLRMAVEKLTATLDEGYRMLRGDVSIRENELSSVRARITPLGGFATKVINKTGANSVKGSLVSASTVDDNSVILQSNEYDTIGIVYEDGIPDGSEMYIVFGGVAEVLYKDTVASVRGNILLAADTDGRAIDITNPGSGLPAAATHFKECGHVLETVSAGTDILVKCVIHFN